jgi:hypothetical protein
MPDQPKHVREFRKFARADPTVEMLEELEKEIYGLNARATIVMMGSFLEVSLRRYIETRLRSDLSFERNKALFDRGPLGSFSGKIEIAYAIGSIGLVTFKDLDIIRELRNGAAHSRVNFTLYATGRRDVRSAWNA